MTVELGVVPHEAQHLVVVGTSLKKPRNILAAYFTSLDWQVKPRGVQVLYCFVDDGLDDDALALVSEFIQSHPGALLKPNRPKGPEDFRDTGITHEWTDTAMQRVGQNKDAILQWAKQNRAEAVWLADADLIMDPMTLTSLWSIPEPIVCGVYWTRWTKSLPEGHPPVHAGPQVWQSHPYTLNGNGMEEWELRDKLMNRQIVHVYGQGACTLIRRVALERGVSFAPWPANTGPGLMQGEDRHFCLRAEALHLRMVADGWPDIFHIYHRPEDEQRIPEMLERLGRGKVPTSSSAVPPLHPRATDLVSLELTALEPVMSHAGPMPVPTQRVRGRLGSLTLHPELEDAVLDMQRGEMRVVPVHFGLNWPFPPYRGNRRLIRVVLIDHKPMGYPPVVEDELIVNRAQSAIDCTVCPPELLDQMREVHAA